MSNQPDEIPVGSDELSRPRPLWAPWRIEYFKRPSEDRCFLCDNTRDDAPEHKLLVARGQTAYLIMNGFPYNSGHVLIVPNRHVGDLAELRVEERNELMELAVGIQEVMRRVMAPQGFNFGFNLGSAAGAGIGDHVHGHLVPRWSGDTNFMPVIGDVRVVPQALEDTARILRENWE